MCIHDSGVMHSDLRCLRMLDGDGETAGKYFAFCVIVGCFALL